jgi:hypothetical protein
LIALGILPHLIGVLWEGIQAQSAGKGSFNSNNKPYIVVCGVFTQASHLKDLLTEFLYRKQLLDERENQLGIVILSPVSADESISSVLQRSAYKHRITFLKGSPVSVGIP